MLELKKVMSLFCTKKRPPEMIKIQIMNSGAFQQFNAVKFGKTIPALPKIRFPRRIFAQTINVAVMTTSAGNIRVKPLVMSCLLSLKKLISSALKGNWL